MTEDYWQILHAALWRDETLPAASGSYTAGEWGGLVEQFARQGIGPLVFPLLTGVEGVPSNILMLMKSVCVQTMQQHVRLQHTLDVAWAALEQAGIHAVLMKGRGLAAFYPEPQMRQWGDIDLFVGKEQYHPACAVMRDTFPDALKFDEELDHYRHYNLIADGISIEVHRVSVSMQHPCDERRYAHMERDGMTHNMPLPVNGKEVRVPEPTFNALFVFLHSWEHMLTEGANLRQLCDLALLLHHYQGQIDGKRLRKYLRALHVTDVWQLYMYIIVRYIGLPETEAQGYTNRCAARAEALLRDLLSGQMTAPKAQTEAPANRIKRKIHTMRERLANARRINKYSPSYARHMVWTIILHGAGRFFAKDRHWE